MPSGWFNRGVYEIAKHDTDLDTDTLKCMLLKSTYAFDRDDAVVNDLVAHEISVAGYSRQTLAGVTITENDTNDATYMTATNPVFGSGVGLTAGQTIGFMVIFRDTGSDATSPLLMCWQIVNEDTDGSEFEFPFSDVGVSKFWSAT